MHKSETRGLSDTPPVDAKALSNLMLDWADEDDISVSPMKLQKLLYFCHADYVVQFSVPLVKQEFEAWDYGPVIPSVYAEFKKFGSNRITSRAMVFNPATAEKSEARCSMRQVEEDRLRRLFSFYRTFSAERLSVLSHEVRGPWRQARALFANGLNMDRRMTRDMIARFHRVIHD